MATGVPARTVLPGVSLIGHQQVIAASKAVTGIFPVVGDLAAGFTNGMIKWNVPNTGGHDGGLFDFGSYDPLVVFLDLSTGDSASVVVRVVNFDDTGAVISGESTTIISLASAGVISHLLPIRLASRQGIQVVAGASTTGMCLRVKAVLEAAFRG